MRRSVEGNSAPTDGVIGAEVVCVMLNLPPPNEQANKMQLQRRDPASTLDRRTCFVALTSGTAVLALGLVATAVNSALLAPPLGVTVFNAVRAPRGSDSDPRTIVLGHAVGLLAGLASIALWVGPDAGSALRDAFEPAHAAAAATAVAITSFGMGAVRAVHPPALATTLVGALGLMTGAVPALAFFAGALAVAGAVALARARSDRRSLRRDHPPVARTADRS